MRRLFRALLRLLRTLWRRVRVALGASSGCAAPAAADQTEQQQLLSPSEPASHQQQQHVVAAPPATTTIIVMRHGHRQDEEDSSWRQAAARPWDPPLSAKGKKQAAEAAARLVGHRVDVVVSSPFKRCLQTSAGLVRGLTGLVQGQWLVDWGVAEVCEPRVLFGGRDDTRGRAPRSSNVEGWMWGGSSSNSNSSGGTDTQAALAKFARDEGRAHALPLQPQQRLPGAGRPVFPEDLAGGLARYAAALQDLAASYAGQAVLVVSHGECVRQAVLMAQPGSEVFEVSHTGFVVLRHQQHQQQQHQARGAGVRARGKWQLVSQPGETGVLWLDDDDASTTDDGDDGVV